jgi:3-deoxy-manno-octulosonate cytidylyltransferase (CMP-KDO synthetase)
VVQHVWERCRQSRYIAELLIATDDERIAKAAREFGANVRMTRGDHQSGTDRVAEVASSTPHDVVVNIQGDEPLIDPSAVDIAILTLLDDPGCSMATLKRQISSAEEVQNPNVVKVVTGHEGYALYFSRSPIPFPGSGKVLHWKHIGIYVYRRRLLLEYSLLKPGPLEAAERLEQLRALENGVPIRVAETEYDSVAVDTPDDLAAVEHLFSLSNPDSTHG